MRWLFRSRRWTVPDTLFSGHYAEVKVMYVQLFDDIPNLGFIGELDVTKAFAVAEERCKRDIVRVYQHTYYDYSSASMVFNNTIFVLTNKRMIELAAGYCQVLYPRMQYQWAADLIKELTVCRIAPEPVKETRVIGFARPAEFV